MRHQVDTLGIAGPLLILALTLIHAIVFYPAEIVDAAAGFVYGFFPALALVMRRLAPLRPGLFRDRAIGGAPAAGPLAGRRRFERAEATIERGGVTLLLAVRLIPILPFSLVSYAAGAARVPTLALRLDNVVGYLPITTLAVYFGTKLEGLDLTDPLVLGSAASPARSAARRQLDRAPPVLRPGDRGPPGAVATRPA